MDTWGGVRNGTGHYPPWCILPRPTILYIQNKGNYLHRLISICICTSISIAVNPFVFTQVPLSHGPWATWCNGYSTLHSTNTRHCSDYYSAFEFRQSNCTLLTCCLTITIYRILLSNHRTCILWYCTYVFILFSFFCK